MSHTYKLVCVDTGDTLSVGKIVCLDWDGHEIPWRFGSWIDQETGNWLREHELLEMVERFLILHRGKEIRILSEPYLHRVDPEWQLKHIDSRKELFDLPVEPEPDDEEDAKQVPPDVKERLKRFTMPS